MSSFKIYSFLVTIAFSISAVPCLSEEPAKNQLPQIIENRTGQGISLDTLVGRLSPFEVIFLGEKHDNDAGHQFQLDVIRGLVDSGKNVVLSTEQFERDVQGALDDYLSDRISEDEFLSVSRPWKNYPQHYRAVIELAKQHKIPVIAANLPRKLAATVSSGKPLQPHELVFAARSTTAPKDRYWGKFVDTMQGHMGAEGSDQMLGFYASQCAKDDAMAEAITDFLAKNRHRSLIVVHLCGHFHSDYGLGTAARIAERNPLLRNVILTMELIPESGILLNEDMHDRAHFTYWTVENTPANAEESGELTDAP